MGAPQYEQAGADIGGTGTTNTIPRWTGPSTLGDSVITQNSTALVTTGSSSATQTTFRVRTVGTANNAPVFSLYREGVNEQVIWAGSGTIRFGFATDPAGYTDAQLLTATKMGIDASGNVGIGTTSPASALHVRNNTAGITLDSTLGGGRQYQLNPLRTGLSNSGFEIRDVTAGAAVISIDASQQVGIGTASPGFKCVVADTVAGVVTSEIRNDSTNSAATARLRFTTQGGESWIEAFRNAGGALTFATLSTERARIDSNGNIYGTSGTTGMTNGFFYIPAAAGAPTGVPTAVAGRVPMYYDTTNNQFYVYNGAWKKVTLA